MQYFAAVLGMLAMAGCGGATGGTPIAPGPGANAYAGSYSGGWRWPYRGQGGNAAGTISSIGQVSLVENNTVSAGSFYISGSIGPEGAFAGVFTAAGGQTPISGGIIESPQGQLVLSFAVPISGVSYMNRATLAPSSPVPFSGVYEGTWNSPSDAEGGSATFSVGQSGELIGSYENSIEDKVLISGIITGTGRFSGAVFSSGHYFGASGSFSLSGSELVGTVNEAVSGNLVTVRLVVQRT